MAFLNGEIRTLVGLSSTDLLSFSESKKLNNTHRKKKVLVLVCRRFHFFIYKSFQTKKNWEEGKLSTSKDDPNSHDTWQLGLLCSLQSWMEGRYMPKNNSNLTTTQARGRKGYVFLLANYYPMTSYVSLLIMANIWLVCQTRRWLHGGEKNYLQHKLW